MARLIESSLWVDFTRSKSPLALKTLIQPWILDPLACLCEPIAFEVLRYATPQEQKWIKAQFETLPLLVTPNHLWRDDSRLGQQCRAAGFNAGSLDLIFAALCIHHDAELITFDADYLAIARVSKLHVHHLSRPLGLQSSSLSPDRAPVWRLDICLHFCLPSASGTLRPARQIRRFYKFFL